MIGISERKTASGGVGRSSLPISTHSSSSSSSSSSSLPTLLLLIAVLSALAAYNLLTTTVTRSSQFLLSSDVAHQRLDPVVEMPREKRGSRLTGQPFHVALTATDSAYNRWQSRIMYYWYRKVKAMPGSEMGGFTRILHSGKPDGLVHEIPTFVVDPLPAGLDRGYIVLNRPWAFVQWLQKANIKEDYILMAEPDHIFVKPLPNLARGAIPAAFPFFYITPQKHEKIIRKFYPEEKGSVTNIDPIGNSPVIILKSQLTEIAPTWMNISLKMKNDEETDKAFGWVLEMYGYAVASALHGVQHILHKDFMIQPPFDLKLQDAYIIHYTYGCDYNLKGELTYGKIGEWRFDKRSHLGGPLPRNISMPPPGVPESVAKYLHRCIGRVECQFLKQNIAAPVKKRMLQASLDLQSGEIQRQNTCTVVLGELNVTLVEKVNEATANIPDWDKGR